MFEFIFNYVEKDTFIKYLRLLMVVCVYIIFRQYYSKYAQDKLIKQQVAQDERDQAEKPEKERLEKERHQEKLQQEAASFGWGKKTRQNAKVQQSLLEEKLEVLRQRNQSAYDAAEDEDIEDLLE